MDLIGEVIKRVPQYEEFKTLEELNKSSKALEEKYPESVDLFELGRSREENPICCLKIGKGKRAGLLFAFPHPDEPVGSMMLDYLSEELAKSEGLRNLLDFSLYIIKVADPDGVKLNEGWFKGPFNLLRFAKNFYRPAGNRQVEWTFPTRYKSFNFSSPIPETKVLMKLINQIKPQFIYSLHNSCFGGVWYYITSKEPLLYPIYQMMAVNQKVPLSFGEPEMPWAKKLADGIYKMPKFEEAYDYLEKYCRKDPAQVISLGASSYDYAAKANPSLFELICEVPYLYDSRIEDLSEGGVSRKKAVLHKIGEKDRIYKILLGNFRKIEPAIEGESRFKEAIEYFLKRNPEYLKAEKHWAETNPELERKATVAEEFDNYLISKAYLILWIGLFVRMINHELKKGKSDLLLQTRDEMEGLLGDYNKNLVKDLHFKPIPIKKLISIQLGAALYTMLYLKLTS